jgi:hypothetical protein
MDEMLPEAVGRHTGLVGMAISDLQYGLGGYRIYKRVYQTLLSSGMTKDKKILDGLGYSFPENVSDGDILNGALKNAIEIRNPASAGTITFWSCAVACPDSMTPFGDWDFCVRAST